MNNKSRMLFLIIIMVISVFSCNLFNSGDGGSDNSTRSFYMGFTPWLYAATLQAQTDVYDFINTNGDLVAHHFQQGIPFTATDILDFNTYEENIKDEINGRIANTAAGKTIYLAIDSLNSSRDALTDLWGSSANMPRTSPWDTRSFNDSEVITAYVNFAVAVINRFENNYGSLPDYFNYAPEISDLMINSPSEFTKFVTFAQYVYSSLKSAYPSIELMVSIALKTPGSTEMQTANSGFEQIKDYVDVVGISTYAYAFYSHSNKGNPDNLPDDWLSQIKTIAPNKPYGITEAAWIAENLSIPAYSLNVLSNETFQSNYIRKLFSESNDIDSEMIIWFTSHDYDTLWTDTLGQDDLSKIWKDTGLINEVFDRRDSLSVWEEWFEKSKQ